jgi:hypothetical protein
MKIADINRKLAKAGHPVNLYRGNGYLYFVWSDGEEFIDESVPVCYYNQMPGQWWLAEALDFAARCAAKIKES